MADGGIVVPLVGALQACVSVLLTMSYGVAAQRLRLIQESSINDMAGLGVKLFLPALIIINLGEQLQLGNALNYIPVLISKTIGYAVGPKLLQDGNESTNTEDQEADGTDPETQNGTTEHGQVDEETSLLPQRALMAPFESPFADVAIGCTIIGVILGLVPQLHKAFFNKYEDGGIFNAWLTSSVKNIGKLFTTLQIFVVGCKLGVSFEKMKTSGDSGRMPLKAIGTIFLVRLVIWPAISIVYGLAKKTNIVLTDPILWFSLMLMPAGPPALVISGLAELARISELEKMAIAKSLTVSDETSGSPELSC
ncbi:unnamed protein product [Aspergillus oryzae var. brunneus]|uniref:Unnamed protein product n=1 Tax=Aspergillus oryzae var. brunneus TaxID=332754 RepID=A0ABQ6KSC4_ASPOZ|nr:unnamed protein product [Aspergillus oryzae]GMG46487.1 unnamed protein product [Aspergillus oryzae var. brunneus]